MKHIATLSRPWSQNEKASILSVMAQLQNLLTAIIAFQELSDLLRKTDTFDNR